MIAAFTSACAVCPHAVHANAAWVRRFSCAQCPQREHVREVPAGFTAISSRPALSALCARIVRNTPQPASRMLRFKPDFCATLRPGRSTVPEALRVMLVIRRSSCAITS